MRKKEKGYRRGHKVVKSKSVKKEDWIRTIHKSRAGVDHVQYKRVLVNV